MSALDIRASDEVRTTVVRATFKAAAEHFDDDPLFFWNLCGARTVELAGVRPGDRVLDVCCGTGASAIPAALRAGPAGRVVGVDLAERQLAKASAKATALGIGTTEFRTGDLERLNQPSAAYDVVICALGIYFAVDIPRTLAQLWRLVCPGGTLAVTTWGPRALEPANSLYFAAVGAQWPALAGLEIPWERVNQPATLTRAFADAGITQVRVVQESVASPTSPDDFWTVVLGSGYRLLVDLLGPERTGRVRARLRHSMERDRVSEIVADILYARAKKKPGPPDRRGERP
jgi:ubiquinone/menaquinone biosynthesis C-methylase UbiE